MQLYISAVYGKNLWRKFSMLYCPQLRFWFIRKAPENSIWPKRWKWWIYTGGRLLTSYWNLSWLNCQASSKIHLTYCAKLNIGKMMRMNGTLYSLWISLICTWTSEQVWVKTFHRRKTFDATVFFALYIIDSLIMWQYRFFMWNFSMT